MMMKKVDDDNERKLNGPTVQEQLLTLFVLVPLSGFLFSLLCLMMTLKYV